MEIILEETIYSQLVSGERKVTEIEVKKQKFFSHV